MRRRDLAHALGRHGLRAERFHRTRFVLRTDGRLVGHPAWLSTFRQAAVAPRPLHRTAQRPRARR